MLNTQGLIEHFEAELNAASNKPKLDVSEKTQEHNPIFLENYFDKQIEDILN